jgi:hypothetical protein
MKDIINSITKLLTIGLIGWITIICFKTENKYILLGILGTAILGGFIYLILQIYKISFDSFSNQAQVYDTIIARITEQGYLERQYLLAMIKPNEAAQAQIITQPPTPPLPSNMFEADLGSLSGKMRRED